MLPCYPRWCTDVQCGTIEATRGKSPSHTDEGIVRNWRSKQSRQGEECGYTVEAGQEGILDVVGRRQEKWKNRWQDRREQDNKESFLKES